MLGVFDTGVGGLTVLRSIHERLPHFSTLYLGDNARAPYGGHDAETIYRWTLESVRFLLNAGCPLVVLACNAASAIALRRMQQDVLPREYPDRRVIGIVRPVGEYLARQPFREVGLLATPATVASGYYVEMMKELGSPVRLTQMGCPGLAGKIERGEENDDATREIVRACSRELIAKNPDLDAVVLACTHFPRVEPLFREALPRAIPLLIQSDIAAASLAEYLNRHLELDLDATGSRRYVTTGNGAVSEIASRVYGKPIRFERVTL